MKADRGFTLVETLVALVIGGLLLTELGWVVSTLAGQLHRQTAGEKLVEEVATIAPILANLIQQAAPNRNVATHTNAQLLYVPAPQALGIAGGAALTLSTDRNESGSRLLAKFEATDPYTGSAHLWTSVLADHLADVQLTAVPPDMTDGRNLPRRIDLLLRATDGTSLPLSFIPRLSSDGACRFDPISLTCRH